MPLSKALFLDRDGIVNVDHGYVYQPDQFDFVTGIFELCQRFQAAEYAIVIVTNQSGIGRGLYSEAEFDHLTEWMKSEFDKHAVLISGVYYCPHHPTKAQADFLRDCQCRKPKPGMLFQAARELALDLEKSVMIGDRLSDMVAAEKAGIPRRILIESQYTLDIIKPDGVDTFSSLNEINPD